MRITSLGLTAATCGASIKGIGRAPELEPIEPESGEFSPTICPMCFAAGTPVHTEHGEEPIEKLKVGERVYALDRATGKTELEPITALVPKHKGNLVDLKIEGEAESLRPSVRHPFWVKLSAADKGHWIEAANLRKGELLETIAGKWSKIEAVVPVKQEETVYNFTVANDHDYFVGETGFLVHNKSCGCGDNRRTVIGRVKDLLNLPPGERNLLDRLPNLGNPQANWKQNFGVLRQEMGYGFSMRDASPGDNAGQFLNAERNALRDRGWNFDEETNLWCPPIP